MNASQLVAFCARLYPRWDGAAVAERLWAVVSEAREERSYRA